MSQVTKRALEQSLKNLLLKKPLTKITINDIAEDCGINRMTFYYHFKDIYDLVGFGAFGGENVLPLEVAVHHDDGGSVPVDVADNDRHGGQPRQLTGVFAAVASN